MKPPLADLDAATAVTRPTSVVWVGASLEHAVPDFEFWGSGHPVGRAGGVSERENSFLPEASARYNPAAHDMVKPCFVQGTAIAPELIVYSSSCHFDAFDGDKSSEAFSRF